MSFPMPQNLVTSEHGLFMGMALWANTVTYGLFWTGMLLAFCAVMFIGTVRYSTPRAFGWASFVGLLGSLILATLKLMQWSTASMFILAGCVGLVVMIMNER